MIGLGTIIGVSGLVWIATSQNNVAVSQESVEPQPEVPSDVHSATPEKTASTITSTQSPSEPKVSDEGVAPSNAPKDEPVIVDLHDEAQIKERTVKPEQEPVVSVPQKPVLEALQSADPPSAEISREVALRREVASVESEFPAIAATTANIGLTEVEAPEVTSEEFIEEELLTESAFTDDELLTLDPIAPPILSEPFIEPSSDHANSDHIDVLTESELVRPESQLLAKNELPGDSSVSDAHMSSGDQGSYRLEEIGIRGGFNAEYVAIPPTEKEDFEHFDIVAAMSFPKRYYYDSGWQIRFRLNGSAGVLRGGGDLGFISTVVPGIVFWYPDWNLSINGGPGLAFVSREKYGEQDLGGPLQIVGQGGITYYVTEHVGVGWRFHHISDAGIWGSDNRGVDVNLFEVRYRF